MSNFLSLLQKRSVTLSNRPLALVGFGAFMYGAPLVFYVLTMLHAHESEADTTASLAMVNIGLHILVGLLVMIEALYTAGTFWPLQFLIIGTATYITFSLPVLSAQFLADDDRVGLMYSQISLGLACFANALLISMLFEYFHRA